MVENDVRVYIFCAMILANGFDEKIMVLPIQMNLLYCRMRITNIYS